MMKFVSLSAVACLMLAAPFSAIGQASPSYPAKVDKELYADNDFRGKAMPKLALEKVLNGSMPDTRGKVILIDFWATWCGPCVRSIPEVNEWKHKFEKDMVIIGLSDEKEEVVSQFMEKTKMEYTVAIDSQRRMSKELGIKGIPHVIVVSADGIVRWQGFPGLAEDKLTTEKLAQIIAASKANVK